MEENKLMEGLNESTVTEVCDKVASSKGGIIAKVAIIAAGVGAAAFAGFKGIKYLKNRKANNATTEDEQVVEAKVITDSTKSNK